MIKKRKKYYFLQKQNFNTFLFQKKSINIMKKIVLHLKESQKAFKY
jgi:23S rRNA maturation-related 3'-5' exoribonuclease YhaM